MVSYKKVCLEIIFRIFEFLLDKNKIFLLRKRRAKILWTIVIGTKMAKIGNSNSVKWLS